MIEKNSLFMGSWDNQFFRHLTADEKKVVQELGKIAYVRQQQEGKQIREEHIRQLTAQIGDLNFQQLAKAKPDSSGYEQIIFGLEQVLGAFGFVFELKYPCLFYGCSDVSFYGCLVKENKPFSQKDESLFKRFSRISDDDVKKIQYGNILLQERHRKEGKFWYLVDKSNEFSPYPIWLDYNSFSSVSRYALLSRENREQLIKYIGVEICWE